MNKKYKYITNVRKKVSINLLIEMKKIANI